MPQGSILGPLLFVLYVDDLGAILKALKSRYTDDTKFGRVIISESDCHLLQLEILEVEKWCAQNNLSSNAAKSNILTVTNKLNPVIFEYKAANSDIIPRAENVKDLGVLIDNSLKFNANVEFIVNKAFRTLGFIMRTTQAFTSITTIVHLYRALVLSQLDYASPV